MLVGVVGYDEHAFELHVLQSFVNALCVFVAATLRCVWTVNPFMCTGMPLQARKHSILGQVLDTLGSLGCSCSLGG